MSFSAVITNKPGFYQKQVLKMLTRMKRGMLSLTMPDGQTHSFGDTEELSAELTIKDPAFFKRCVLYGDIGFGEAYVEGNCDSADITKVVKWFILNLESTPGISGSAVRSAGMNLLKLWNKISHWGRVNSLDGSKQNIAEHYDLSNDFFALFLDPSMTYSCAYFKDESLTLQQAQEAKLERLSRELRLKPGMRVLEIGSGWGSNAIYMSKKYGVSVKSITISEAQKELAMARVKEAGMENLVEISLCDYREVEGEFDRIVSIEMLEAVGDEYLDVYFKKCHELLKKDGILAFQVITCPDSRYEDLKNGVDWIQKHIFPGTLLPSVGRLNQAINATGDLTLIDLKDLGQHYAITLNTWKKNFNDKIERVRALGFNERFIRKWNYYFSYCEAAFAMRNINVMQMVYCRPNNNSN